MGACLTPFDDQGRVKFDVLKQEIDFIVEDADAITIAAVEAAEYTMLSIEERQEIMRQAVQMVDGRIPVILGASHPAPAKVIELAEYCAKIGGDMVQVLMPLRPWGPVIAYHNPGPGADPNMENTIRISEIFNVCAFKESSRDIVKITRLIEEIELSGNARYFTTMQPLLMTLVMGGSGATMPPPGTKIGARVVKAFREGNMEEAKYWQRFYSLFPAKWAAYGLPPVMKSALRHFGLEMGDPIPPYKPVTPRDHAQIGEFLRQIGLLEEGEPPKVSMSEVVSHMASEDTFLR
jgi:4-hydroxy-tetrahydrodipicolinate synthase